ncbi:MAG: tetratricopeptide repeat protein, partial [Bryobacteraceae bacterium]
SEDRVRVTVQLVAVADGATLWAGQFDDPFTDIFSVEDSISQQVTRTLMLKLTGDETRKLSQRHTTNTEAHQAYLRGRYYWNRRTETDLRKSVRCFQEAVNLDPSYALAYVGLADSYSVLGGYSDLPPKEAYSRTRAAALQALEIDETLAEAHTSLGDYLMYLNWDAPGAEREYRRAIELRPDYATAHHFYAWFLMSQGKFAEASAEMRRAQELDPLSPMINTTVGLPLYFARQFPEAISHFEKSVEAEPGFDLGFVYLGRAYVYSGMYDQGIAALRNAVALSGGRPVTIAALSHALAMAGEVEEAIELRDTLIARSQTRYVSPYYFATIFAGLGDRKNTLRWLESAFEDRSNQLVVLGLDPAWDRLRDDRDLKTLIARVGFGATPR